MIHHVVVVLFFFDLSNCHCHNRFLYCHMSSQLIGKLQDKCGSLPSSHKKALSADSDEIMHTTPADVGIYYDDDGQHMFVVHPPQESLQVCPSCFITHLIHSSCLLLTNEQRSIYLSIYVYCVFSREEVCQYFDAVLVPDQRSSP